MNFEKRSSPLTCSAAAAPPAAADAASRPAPSGQDPRSLDWLHLLDCPTVPFVMNLQPAPPPDPPGLTPLMMMMMMCRRQRTTVLVRVLVLYSTVAQEYSTSTSSAGSTSRQAGITVLGLRYAVRYHYWYEILQSPDKYLNPSFRLSEPFLWLLTVPVFSITNIQHSNTLPKSAQQTQHQPQLKRR